MATTLPNISLLNPVVLPDNRRVTMELIVENLPGGEASNVISFFDTPPATGSFGAKPHVGQQADSQYPDVVLSILNSNGAEAANLLIVEHKETHTSLTLHLRAPQPAEQYTARAEMSLNDKILQIVEIPFKLHQVSSTD